MRIRPRDLRPGDRIVVGRLDHESTVLVLGGPTVVTDTAGEPIDSFTVRVDGGGRAEVVFRRDARRVRVLAARRIPLTPAPVYPDLDDLVTGHM